MADTENRRKLQDPRVVRQLATALLSGVPLAKALKRAGVSQSTYYRELRRSPELREAFEPDAAGKPAKAKASKPAERRAASKAARASRARTKKRGATAPSPEKSRAAADRPRRRKAKRSAVPLPSAPSEAVVEPQAAAAAGPTATERRRKRRPSRSAAPEAPAAAPPELPTRELAPETSPIPRPTPPPRAVEQPPTTPELPEPIAATTSLEAPATELPPAQPTTPRPRLSSLVRNPYTISGPADGGIGISPVSARPRPHPRASEAAPSGGDWMPPMAVLLLQLVVALAVGAHPLVIGLIVVTSLGVGVAVWRARKGAPRAEDVMAADVGPTEELAQAPGTQNGQGPEQDALARNRRPMDLRWISSTILPAGESPDDPTIRRPRS